MALTPGQAVPAFEIVRAHGDIVASADLWRDGPTIVLYYVFDWSGTEGG